ncbi:MAG: OmpA family protein [Sedimentisphaerales bacterium]|nr:OmpA family protein [Sedimentisphaerales bacterium]
MKRRKKDGGGGAPEWIVTFGDMMSLLLCFFVILVSLSELKEDEKYMKVRESIKRAFGYEGGVGYISGNNNPTNTLEKQLTNLLMRKWQLRQGKTTDQGIEGQSPSVKKVRDGLEYTIGGAVSFEPGKAVLLEHARQELSSFAEDIQGMNNKIRVRGHTARISPDLYRPFASLDDLSYARATAVKEHLIRQGIRPERITLEACADNEPLRSQAYDPESRAFNDRVSIIVTETLVNQFQGEPASDTRDIIDG